MGFRAKARVEVQDCNIARRDEELERELKAKLLRVLLIAVILSCLVSLLPILVSAQTSIANLDDLNSMGWPVHKQSFYAAGRLWVSYEVGTQIYVRSSADSGTTWSSATKISTTAIGQGRSFNLYFDGTYVHYVYSTDGALAPYYYRRGLPYGNGTIVLDAEDNTGLTSYGYFGSQSIAVDSNGFPWIAYSYWSAAHGHIYAAKSSTNDGTWTTEAGDPEAINADAHYSSTTLIPLTGGKLALLYGKTNSAQYKVYAMTWSGAAWGAITSTTSAMPTDASYEVKYSATVQGDDVYVVFLKTGTYDIIYTEYSGSAFGAETTLYSGATEWSAPVILRDTTTNNLHVFWENDPTDDHMYYNRYNASTGNWTGYYDLINEADGLPAEGWHLNVSLTAPFDNSGIFYMAGANILKFKLLAESFEVTTLYANGINDVYATLYGSIDSLSFGSATTIGFIYKAGADPLGGGATDLHEHGTYTAATYHLTTLPTLTPSTLYHFRFYATNAFGTVIGEDEQFYTAGLPTPTPAGTPTPAPTMPPGSSCTTAPEITTQAATYVSMTSARLNALLTDDGGGETYIRFQYYTGAGTWTDNETAWVGGYWDGHPNAYVNISGLTGNTTYHFRAQAVNPCGNDTGADLTFTTLAALDNVADFLAIPRANQPTIDLYWQKPTGATEVLIRYKLGAYPGNSTDGILVIQVGTTNGFAHEELTAGDTLYYSAWGVSGNYTSTTAAHAIATVSLAISPTIPAAPDMPANWFVGVQYTNMSGMPFYDVINTVSDAFGFNRQFFWGSLGFLIALLVFIASYRATQARVMVALIATTVVMGIETKMGLMAGFMILVLLLLSITAWAIERK